MHWFVLEDGHHVIGDEEVKGARLKETYRRFL